MRFLQKFPTPIILILAQVVATAATVPLNTAPGQQYLSHETSTVQDLKLNFTSPSPYVFSSLRSLLRQWPNTFFPNGHSIVPCEVPIHTKLFHGRFDAQIPPDPEWFAFDIDMSYAITGSSPNSHMLTYQTVKAVSCLYFDGMSAALMGTGQLDSQMVFLYGNTSGPSTPGPGHLNPLRDEYARASGLCKWVQDNHFGGLGWGIEGIVRMNAGFEMIWCNFSSPSIRLLTHLNVTAPTLLESIEDPPAESTTVFHKESHVPLGIGTLQHTRTLFPLPTSTLRNSPSRTDDPPFFDPPASWNPFLEPFIYSSGEDWLRSATWHYGGLAGRGEDRVKLLTCGFLTYYDPIFHMLALNRSSSERSALNLTEEGRIGFNGRAWNYSLELQLLERRRRNHTIEAIDSQEAKAMTNLVADWLRSANDSAITNGCTGVDWVGTAQDIAIRYSEPLRQLLQDIKAPKNVSDDQSIMWALLRLRERTHALLMPFLEYPSDTTIRSDRDSSPWTLHSELGKITLWRCKYAYTRLVYSEDGHLLSTINHQERLLISSTEEVLSAICSTIIDIGFGLEYYWLSRYSATPRVSYSTFTFEEVSLWQVQLQELIAWLGWASDDVRCETLCAKDEICYIPMWPLIFGRDERRRHRRPANGTNPRYPYSHRGGYGDYIPTGPPRLGIGIELEKMLWQPRCRKIGG